MRILMPGMLLVAACGSLENPDLDRLKKDYRRGRIGTDELLYRKAQFDRDEDARRQVAAPAGEHGYAEPWDRLWKDYSRGRIDRADLEEYAAWCDVVAPR